MSNARIFCWGFVTNCALLAALELFDFPARFGGLSGVIANFLFASAWGICAVALFGDRAITKGNTNG